MSKSCCKYHDNFWQVWDDAGVWQPTDLNECGMAGPGAVTLCCENCPLLPWYKENQPGRPVVYIKDTIAKFKGDSQHAPEQ